MARPNPGPPTTLLPAATRGGSTAFGPLVVPDAATRIVVRLPRPTLTDPSFLPTSAARGRVELALSINGASSFALAKFDFIGGRQNTIVEKAPGQGLVQPTVESVIKLPAGINRAISGTLVMTGAAAKCQLDIAFA